MGLGLLALGPALVPGFLLSYDMVFVPNPPIDAADFGLGGGAPRVVPSDLFVALVARVMPADAAEKLILLAIFVLACTGAAALVAADASGRRASLPGRLAAGVCYAWNPFVAERLIMGQWALLLGYAGLPWVLRELRGNGGRIRLSRLAVALIPATIGGFAAVLITAMAVMPVAACGTGDWRIRRRRLAITVVAIALASLPWLVPALAIPVHSDPNGAYAFAARSDTVFGPVASLLMLGGIWNAEAVPAGYGGPASAVWLALSLFAYISYLRLARPRRICPGVGLAACAGAAFAALGLLSPGRTALHAAIAVWPGFALLRDGQQFLAPLALALAIGLGSAVDELASASASRSVGPTASQHQADEVRSRRRSDSIAGPAMALSVMAVMAPVLLLPGLAWGAAGRLRAVNYPADWQLARSIIDDDRAPGSVLLLPWAQYRRYPWNNGEAVYDPWTRLVTRTMIWNDALRVGSLTVAPENPATLRFSPIIASAGPMTTALKAAGVRFVIVDAGPLLGRRNDHLENAARLPGAVVVLASSDLIVFRLPDTTRATTLPTSPRQRQRFRIAQLDAQNVLYARFWLVDS